jgi:radical SAM superfamily enzyme YgiQ (UPF0313 family)
VDNVSRSNISQRNKTFERVVLVRVDRERTADEWHPRHIHPPLDLFYIRSTLTDRTGNIPDLVDGWLNDNHEMPLLDRVLCLNPDVVVIRSMSWSINEANQLALALKQRGIVNIAVGEQVTHVAEHNFAVGHRKSVAPVQPNPALEQRRQYWDFPILGEPEQAVPELMRRLRQGKSSAVLAEEYWDRLVNRRPFQVDTRETLAHPVFNSSELQAYPFPFPVPGGVIRRWGYLISGWGCPYHCQHCTQVVRKSIGTELRLRNPVEIVDEIEQLVASGAEGIAFEDDTLFCNRKHLLAVCSEIIHRDLKVSWIANARPDELDAERITAAAQAGAALLKIGIESGSAELIEKMGKSRCGDQWLQQVHKGVSLLKQHGIASVGLFMVGMPEETEAQVQQTIDLSRLINTEYIQVQRFTAYADVAMTRQASTFGPRQTNLYHYASQDQTLASIQVDRLDQLQKNFYSGFYLRPLFIYTHLKLFWRWYLTRRFLITLPARMGFLLGMNPSLPNTGNRHG